MGEMIRLTAGDGHQLDAYRANPASVADGVVRGCLVVAQEIFGVNGHIRDVVDRFAGHGYVAIAPALFDRVRRGVEYDYNDNGVARGQEITGQLGWEKPLLDVAAAAAELNTFGPVGVVGYCWGGSVAWLAACRLNVAAAVCYYGRHILQYMDETPRAPVMLHYGENDANIPMTDVEAVRSAHADVPVHVYPAGHGFNCDRRADYNSECAEQALSRTLAFFGEHLVRG